MFKLAPVPVSPAPVVVGFGEFWVEPDRFGEMGDGLVELALVSVDGAPVAVGCGVFRIESDGFGGICPFWKLIFLWILESRSLPA